MTTSTTYININNTTATADGKDQQLLTGRQTVAAHADTVNNNKTTSPLVGLVSGCAGAVALVYVGQPLDTVKVRMQLATATVTTSSGGGVSMWSCVRDMWRQALVAPTASRLNNATTVVGGTGGVGGGHGVVETCSLSSTTTTAGQWTNKAAVTGRMVRLMYAGTAPALLANVAENGVLFAAYGPCQRLVAFAMDLFNGGGGVVDDAGKKLGPAAMATAGSLASLCSAFALCPTELIKVRLQAADLERCNTEVTMRDVVAGKRRAPPAHAGSTLQVVARVWTTEGGLRGMYRGLGSTVVREMPGYYVFFLAYEASRNYLNAWIGKTTAAVVGGGGGGAHGAAVAANQEDPAWVTMTAGAAAGTCLWLAVYPVDAIKSRIQATGSGGGCDNSSGSFLKSFTLTVRNEGPLALYRGLAPTMIRTVPASAVMFWAVERTKTLLTGYGL